MLKCSYVRNRPGVLPINPQWVVSGNRALLLSGSAYVFSVSVGDNPHLPLEEPLVCAAVVGGQVFVSGGDGTGFFEEWEPVDGGERGEMIVSADETLLRSIVVRLKRGRR